MTTTGNYVLELHAHSVSKQILCVLENHFFIIPLYVPYLLMAHIFVELVFFSITINPEGIFVCNFKTVVLHCTDILSIFLSRCVYISSYFF